VLFFGALVAFSEWVKNAHAVKDFVTSVKSVPWLEAIIDGSNKVLLGIAPSAFQKEVAGQSAQPMAEGLWIISKLLIISESVVALALATLFVMAVNRRFRR
jgi:hypothetical protein